MSWVWPECINRDLPLTKQQRKLIHLDARILWWANKWNVVLYLTLPAFYLLIIFLTRDVVGRAAVFIGAGGLIDGRFRVAAAFALYVVCFIMGGAVLHRHRFAPCVYRATREHGFDICLKCGYGLRGLGDDTERCPECGTPIET